MKPVFAAGLLLAATLAGQLPAQIGTGPGPAPAELAYAPDASTVVNPDAGTETTPGGMLQAPGLARMLLSAAG